MASQTASSNTCTTNNVERLKAEGNALHQSRQYQAAYNKYAEAIKQDPKNAVLWANRAASALSMKKYMDAISDAEKVLTPDVRYKVLILLSLLGNRVRSEVRESMRKSGHRALCSWGRSVEAFKKALECLPSSKELTKQDQVLKTQFEEGLKKAEAAMNCPPFNPIVVPAGSSAQNNLPWKRAIAMEAQLIAQQNANSSAFEILHAYREFQRGLDGIKQTAFREINGQRALVGTTGVIEALTNAILRDKRVFHIVDNDFLDRYNNQMMLEISRCNAWQSGGPQTIQDEAPKRLKTLGWGAVRPALAVTIRGWIMRGFLQTAVQLPGSSEKFLRHALDVLEWGARVWKDVPREDRGTIFDATFIRGVKHLYLTTLMESYSRNTSKEISLEDIAKLAREIIAESTNMAAPKDAIDPAFFASFYTYPHADALVILGWYYMRRAFQADDKEESLELFEESAAHYIQGANIFHKDDEFYVSYLKGALEAHWFRRSPLRVTLPLCKQIREAIPDMKKIWEYSSGARERDDSMKTVLNFEKHYQELLAQGKVTLESIGALDLR